MNEMYFLLAVTGWVWFALCAIAGGALFAVRWIRRRRQAPRGFDVVAATARGGDER
jgi:hypothetical protein